MMTLTTAGDTDRLALTGEVRAALRGLMEVESYAWDERGALTLRGRLSGPAATLYRPIRAHLEALGFTPFLRRVDDADEILAAPGVVERRAPRFWLPAALFLLTVVSTLMTGALYEGVNIFEQPSGLLAGAPFAATLLTILFVHEMGHYVVGRLRHAPVSLPYFIPVPPFPTPGGLVMGSGTMGAVIVQREPMEDRRTVLEIGIAGPLAGLAVAIPLLIYGLATSAVGPMPAGGYTQEGNSLLYAGLKWLVYGRLLPSGFVDVQLNSMAWGAWIGLLVTMMNLMPIGQLDGGHIAYALFGRYAEYVAYGMIGVCLLLGALLPDNFTWLVWAGLALVFGARHPPPLNDITDIGGWHVALAVFGMLVFALLFMPAPLRQVGG